MSRPYRDTFTATEMPDGSVRVKLHGYPMEFNAPTAKEAMQAAGEMMDEVRKMSKRTMAILEGEA